MPLLEIKDLYKEIDSNRIISNVNLSLDEGQCVAIRCKRNIGSIFLNIIIGEILPSNGEILYDGQLLKDNFKDFSKEIGVYLLEYKLYERMSVQEYLKFFKTLYSSKISIDNLLRKIGLLDKQNVKIHKLSYSQKQRVHIARAVINNPKLLLLEEPTQNIDLESCIIIRKLLSDKVNEGMSIIFTTSSYEEAEALGTEIYTMDEKGLHKNIIESKDVNKDEDIITIDKNIKIEKIPAKVNDKIILFNPLELIFIESNEGNSYLNARDEKLPCPLTLQELEKRLEIFGFYRCHRSYIVNLQRVREVIPWSRNSYSLILDDEKETSIPLSKGRFDKLKDILGI